MYRFLALLLIMIVLASSIPALARATRATGPDRFQATLYVNSVTGNDAFNCLSPVSPCKTLAGAVGKAANGDAINIAAGVYPTNNVQLDKSLTVTGAGRDATFLDANLTSRILQVNGASTISNLSIRNGRITTISGNIFETGGGGILSSAPLTLRDVTLSNNSVTGSGGAIFHLGDLTIESSQIISNTADGNGGGIYSYGSGTLRITGSLIANNQADDSGGGIDVSRPTFLTDVTLRSNQAGNFGGGLVVFQALQLHRVAMHGNAANAGAAIFAQAGSIGVTNSTISGNTAGNNYGGIAISGVISLDVRNSTIAFNSRTNTAGVGFNGLINSSGTVTVANSIIANNQGRNCGGSTTNWTSLGYNISSDNTCAFVQTGDLQPADPNLAPLADNGGPTPTHALLPGSPAIDSGDNTQCPATDQRLVTRPFDGDGNGSAICDRGAFEARGQIVIADQTVTEGQSGTTQAVFTVTLSPEAVGPVSVAFATTAGTATAGNDYIHTSGVLSWNNGESVKTISVPVIGDLDDEADETFGVQLSNPTNADIIDGSGAGLILDDDGLSTVSINSPTVLEGNSGTTDLVFTVTVSPSSAQQVSVDYAAANGSAVVGLDFDAASGSLVFTPGQTTRTVTVKVRGDTIDEGAGESFTLALLNSQGASITGGPGTGTITDDDVAFLRLTGQPEAAEGDAGLRPLNFNVSLSLPASFVITVDYHTGAVVGSGHATPDVDFVASSGKLTFQPGQISKTITVNAVGDVVVEPDEDFFVAITNGTVAISGSQETGRILNDDQYKAYLPSMSR